MKQTNLIRTWKDKLGAHIDTIVHNCGPNSLSIKRFENGFVLKKAKRGEIVLDFIDLMSVLDLFNQFKVKKEVLENAK